MHYFYLTVLVLSLNATHGTEISNLIEDLLKILDSSEAENKNNTIPILKRLKNFFQDDRRDETNDNDVMVQRNMPSKSTETGSQDDHIKTNSPATPLPNSLKNRRLWRSKKKSVTSSSSEVEEEEEKQFFLDDWADKRLRLKFEALNSTEPIGNVINMKSARPWGVACGDPNQHDLPWGTCNLAVECDAEYRIYRGDSFCGRTTFVCCALVRTSYDLYQGLDMSYEHEDSLSTDSEDEKSQNSHEARHQARKKQKQYAKRRRRAMAQLKKKIRSSINRVVTEITKLMQKAYRNGTAQRFLKTRQLLDFIKKMKLQYKEDRKSAVDAHELDMMKYDARLQDSLDKVLGVNERFLNNDTFRDIVVNGTVNRERLTNLQRTHPVLSLFFSQNRRMGGRDIESESMKIKPETEEEDPTPEKETPKHFEYDLEYGMLYF